MWLFLPVMFRGEVGSQLSMDPGESLITRREFW